jgi:dihydroflavonol-4-reductase
MGPASLSSAGGRHLKEGCRSPRRLRGTLNALMDDREGKQGCFSAEARKPPHGTGSADAATVAAPKSSSPPSTVLVTGASGFVGSAIAAALRAGGHQVLTLVRPSSQRTNLDPRDTVLEGDLRDRVSLAIALKGVRFLFHAAADYRLWARNPDETFRNNVEGTRLLMEEALRAGVERIVYTSSVATLKLVDGAAANEDRPLDEESAVGAYKRSKVAAERLVGDMVRRDGLPAVIVNPSTPIGPRDVRPTPTGRIIVEAASGRMPGFVDTGLNLVHVDDVAAGHVAALERGRIGERYILGGENVFLVDMLAEIARLVGRRPPSLKLPRRMLYPVAYGAQLIARVRGGEPFVTVDGLRMARRHMFFDDSKARRELGHASRSYRGGLADAIAWFRSHGYLA